MDIDNWINLIVAILVGGGTLFLGIMAWRTICQTRNFQKAEKRERLLNEIIEWAIDVSKRGSELDFILLAAQIDEEPWGKINIPTIQSNLRELKQRGNYVIKIARIQDSLLSTAQKVEEEVDWYLKSTDDLFIKISLSGTGGENLSEIFKPMIERASLVKCANDLIEEASKIKTVDLS
jgi:hypothetical protein